MRFAWRVPCVCLLNLSASVIVGTFLYLSLAVLLYVFLVGRPHSLSHALLPDVGVPRLLLSISRTLASVCPCFEWTFCLHGIRVPCREGSLSLPKVIWKSLSWLPHLSNSFLPQSPRMRQAVCVVSCRPQRCGLRLITPIGRGGFLSFFEEPFLLKHASCFPPAFLLTFSPNGVCVCVCVSDCQLFQWTSYGARSLPTTALAQCSQVWPCGSARGICGRVKSSRTGDCTSSVFPWAI
jgi:hypothetical protein